MSLKEIHTSAEDDNSVLGALNTLLDALANHKVKPRKVGSGIFFFYDDGVMLNIKDLGYLLAYKTDRLYYGTKIAEVQSLVNEQLANQGFTVPTQEKPNTNTGSGSLFGMSDTMLLILGAGLIAVFMFWKIKK